MILRKPYAFLIKHFKLIHAFLTAVMLYLLLQTYNINKFFDEFKKLGDLKAELGITDTLFNDYMFLVPWIVIVLTLILLGIMIRKQKPKLFYLVNIGTNIATILLYSYLHSEILFMETNIMSGQRVNLVNDLAFMLLLVQMATIITPIIRTLGLDLKRFDFGKDLLELEINEEDNEEVEISVDFETNVAARKFNKSKRFLKYFYLENMLMVNIALIILVGTIGYIVFINVNVYSAHYKQGDTFDTGDSMVTISNSYVTTMNSKGNVIVPDGKTLVILKASMSASGEEYFNTAKAQLHVDGKNYYPKREYAKELADLGTTYKDDKLDYEYENYLLVYEIPKASLKEKIYFRYLNEIDVKSSKIDAKFIGVDLDLLALEQDVEEKELLLNEEFKINEDVMGETKINITNIELKEEFIVPYKFCLTRVDCYDSIEHVKPLLNTNYDKALIKIEGNITLDENMNIKAVKNIYNVITYFGKVKYVKDGKTYTINNFTKVEPKKIDKTGTYYVEVNKNVLDAEEAYLILKSRNREYKYVIKGIKIDEETKGE